MYASRRRAPWMIRRSPRRAGITGREKSRLSQRSNPNSWQKLRPWRLTDRSADGAPASLRAVRRHPACIENKKVAFARSSFCLRFCQNGERFLLSLWERLGEGAKLSDPIKHQLTCSIPSLPLRVQTQCRATSDSNRNLDEARNDVEHRDRTQ